MPPGLYYRAYSGTTQIVPETWIAADVSPVQLQAVELAAPNLPGIRVLYRGTAGAASGIRLSPLGTDGSGSITGDDLVADSSLSDMRWDRDRFLLIYPQMQADTMVRYFATLTVGGQLSTAPHRLGTDLEPLGHSLTISVARSPTGAVAVGVERLNGPPIDAFLAFLVPQ